MIGNDDIGEPDYCIWDNFLCDGQNGSCKDCDRNLEEEKDAEI